MEIKITLKKIWHFLWHEDSLLSWVVSIILAFIIVKFIIYPGIGLILHTNYPIVAVVSSSMEHNNLNFDEWWEKNKDIYSEYGFNKSQFKSLSFSNGFNKGDIMILYGTPPQNLKIGAIIVYKSPSGGLGRSNLYPIIHRVVVKENRNNIYVFKTKGDNLNNRIDPWDISENQILGRAIFRIPLLGYVKIIAADYIAKPYCELTNNLWPCRR